MAGMDFFHREDDTPTRGRRGLAIASLVLGMVGLLSNSLLLVPVIGPFILLLVAIPALLCAALAIIFAILGRRSSAKLAAIVGLILGCLTFLLFLGLWLFLLT